jgi:sec-independent protein translocase protein TatA
MGGLSWWHWVIIIGVFIVVFGSKRLPDAARGVGRSLRILKSEVSAMQDDDNKAKKVPSETDATAAVPTPTAQITGAPTPPVAPQPVAPQPPASGVPVVNGVPAEDHRT